MDRSERRYHTKRKKVRIIREYYDYWGPNSLRWTRPVYWWQIIPKDHYMGEYHREWNNQMMTRPARHQQRQWLRAIEKGTDPDLAVWPDYKRPHVYYW